MVLNLNKEISASKNVKILKSGFFCAFVIVGGKIARNLARKAGRKRNYTLVIFSKQFFIYSWLLIESVNKSGRNKLNKIFISGVVFAKKNKVITPIKLMLFAETRAVGNINFASDYRFYIIFLCFFIKSITPYITPWSVMATAFCPSSLIRGIRRFMRQAPSRRLYSVWR